MRGLVLAGAAVVLICGACGSAASPGAGVIAAARKHAATLAAQKLLKEFALPLGAVRTHGMRDAGSAAEPPGAAKSVNRFAVWRVPLSFSSALAWMRAHRPVGFTSDAEGSGFGGHWIDWQRDESRFLTADVARTRGHVLIRVDATAIWIYPHPSSEKVPSAVREVDIQPAPISSPVPTRGPVPTVSRRVTDGREVARIVRWFDALPVIPPGEPIGVCSLPPPPDLELAFRSADGKRLASADVPNGWTGVCGPISFWIAGKKQLPLIDKYVGRPGPYFIDRVGKLLGVTL